MPDSSYTIRIGSTSDTGGMDRAEASLKRCDTAARGFVDSIKMGVGIDLGGRLVQSIASLPGMFESLVQRGVAFNAEMSNSEAGMARVIGKFLELDDVAAKNAAAKAMKQIVELEPQTAGTMASLVQGFMATSASALSAGMSVEQNIDLVGKFANALQNANIPAEQLSQELRSIFAGNITSDSALAKVLQIDNADVAKAKQAGDLYGFLAEKVGQLGEAGDTNAVRMSSLESAIDKLLATATKPIFDEINAGLLTLTEQLNDPSTAAALKGLGHDIAGLVGNGVKLTAWAIENADMLVATAKAAGTLAVAFAAVKLTELLAGLAGMTVNLLRNTTAISAETAALSANTTAQAANVAARRFSAGEAAASRDMMKRYGGDASKLNQPSAGTLAGGIGAAYTTTIISSLIMAGIEAWSAKYGAKQEERQAKGAEATAGVDGMRTRFDGLNSATGRDLFVRDSNSEIESLGRQRNQPGAEKGLIDQQIKAYGQLRDLAEKLTEEDFKRADAAKAAAVAAKEQADANAVEIENADKLQAYRNARGQAFNDDQRSKRTDAALGDGSASALQRRIAELEAELQTKPQITDNKTPIADVQRRDQERDAITAQLEQTRAAVAEQKQAAAKQDAEDVAAREKENNDAAVKALQDELALLEAIHQQYLANIEASGGDEATRAAKRRNEEAEFATVKLHQDDKIGLLQGESADAREARHIAAATADIERDTAAKAAQKIDPKTTTTKQKHFGTEGIEIGKGSKDDHLYKTGTRLGANVGPVSLRPAEVTAAELATARRAALQPASLLPPAARPSSQGTDGKDDSAAARAAGAAAEKTAKALDAVAERFGKSLDGFAAKVDGVGPNIDAASTAITTAIERLNTKIENLKGQIQNTGAD